MMEQESSSGSYKPPRKKAKYAAELDPSKRDLATLPHVILLNIFKFLDHRSINNCAMLCSTLNNVAKNSLLYKNVTLKYNMSSHFLESLISKTTQPRDLYIECKSGETQPGEDYSEFFKYVGLLLRKSGECLRNLRIESCKNDEVLLNISECINLTSLGLYRCRSTFKTLPTLTSLKRIHFVSCHFPQKIVSEVIENNLQLKNVFLADNVNVNPNEVCEIMSKNNFAIKELHLSERKKLKARSLRTLARLKDLRSLDIISQFECDPEDSLEQVAAGCTKLERLAIYGWKELNDENFIPALRMLTQLKELDIRGTNITIKTCQEAALTLPKLRMMDVYKSRRIKKAQLIKLQHDFEEIDIPVE